MQTDIYYIKIKSNHLATITEEKEEQGGQETPREGQPREAATALDDATPPNYHQPRRRRHRRLHLP